MIVFTVHTKLGKLKIPSVVSVFSTEISIFAKIVGKIDIVCGIHKIKCWGRAAIRARAAIGMNMVNM